MAPRPRTVDDAAILAAAARVMQRVGPADLTLAEIAAEAGLTAGALVQRFGSKRGLMVALAKSAAEGHAELTARLRADVKSPLGVLRACAAIYAELAPWPEVAVRNLAYLQNDLTDPQLYGYLLTQARATRRWYERLIREAVKRGELKPDTNVRRLARTVDATLGGSLMAWTIHREGTAAAWLQRDLDAALTPYRVEPSRRRVRARRKRLS